MNSYVCLNCEQTFDDPMVHIEMHGFTYGPGEKLYLCPFCGSEDFIDAIYCDICDNPIVNDYIKTSRGELICENCYTQYNAQE